MPPEGKDLLGDLFNQHGPPTEAELLVYPFPVKVAVVVKRPPRHKYFEWFRDIGRVNVERLFNNEPLKVGDGLLTFVFPERWMSVEEQTMFMLKVLENPNKEAIKELNLVTSSPMILSDFTRTMIRMIYFSNEEV